MGAAVCVIVDGVTVVDLAGGWADQEARVPWQLDTLVDFYSVGKAFLALCALQLVDAGLVALDDPVARVWPEFAAGGKDAATLRHALCHRAGVPAIRTPLTNEDLWDWDRMAAALAATEPWWEPGTRHAYHTNTYGHLIGEVIRRVSGATVRHAVGLGGRPARGRRLRGGAGRRGRALRHRVLRRTRAVGRARRRNAAGRSTDGDAELLQPAGLFVNGSRQHARLARRGGAVDERPRHGARRRAHVRGAASTRSASSRPSCCRRRCRRSRRASARSSTKR